MTDEIRRDLDGIDQSILRISGMGVEPDERQRHRIGGKAFVLEFATRAPVHGVGVRGAKCRDVEVLRSAPDLFVRCEGDFDRPVWNVGMRDEVFGRRDNLGDTSLVVGAQQGRP